MITLKPITKENWHAAIRLDVAPEQRKFVASNLFSIAESQFEPGVVPLGIYNEEDTMVGFLMYGPYHGEMWIWRLMVGQQYQQRGYGRAAMQAIIDALRDMGHTEIFLSHEPENTVGAEFYTGLGFEDTGCIDGGELVRRLVIE
jgi:diamine N-acetyltransferase